LVVCETTSKLSMVLLAWLGKPMETGMGSRFIDRMHGKTARFIFSLTFTIFTAGITLGWIGIGSVAAGLLSSLVLLEIANMNIKGVTGDVLGAANEITRTAALILIAGVSC
jgi:adenosylcobinamide-GDP ribazoletransferase